MSTETRDINDVFDDLLLAEERLEESAYDEGFSKGSLEGNSQGYHIGYHRGAELGAELGYYLGVVSAHLPRTDLNERLINQLTKVKELIESFPRTNVDSVDYLALADSIRTLYRRVCSQLKINGQNPYAGSLSF